MCGCQRWQWGRKSFPTNQNVEFSYLKEQDQKSILVLWVLFFYMASPYTKRKDEWKEAKKEGKNQNNKTFIDVHIFFEILYFTPKLAFSSWEKTTDFV